MKNLSGPILFAKIRPTSLPPKRGFLQALTVLLNYKILGSCICLAQKGTHAK